MLRLMMQLLIVYISILILLLPSPAAAQLAGTLDFDNGVNKYKVYNGASWNYIGDPIVLTSCNATKKAQIDYDPLLGILKYCNGSVWMTMVGLPTLALCSDPGKWRFNDGYNSLEICNGLLWMSMN